MEWYRNWDVVVQVTKHSTSGTIHNIHITLQMVIFINNSEGNSRWQKELGLLGHTGLRSISQF